MTARASPAAEPIKIDLTQWTPPDIAMVGDDPFGKLVKYGHALFADTANEIGPAVSDPGMRFAGNNLACQNCHLQAGSQPYAMPLIGVNGAGYQFPPLWGPDSFNNGAGMSRLLTAAAYAMHTMPIGTTFDAPVLSDEDAYDVAAYIISQKRPQKANLDRDFPIRLQKPIDTPYGPYADGFSVEQHRFGPFGPIRAKVRELAAESGTASAGGPDNGSDEFRRAR
jgi:thiosulfate dehydrogenase